MFADCLIDTNWELKSIKIRKKRNKSKTKNKNLENKTINNPQSL